MATATAQKTSASNETLDKLVVVFDPILSPLLKFLEIIAENIRLYVDTLFYLGETFKDMATSSKRRKSIVDGWLYQFYWIGNKSASIVLSTIAFVGMISIVEMAFQMGRVLHSTDFVPGFAALIIFREFASVIPATMMAGKVGAGITAELGTMKITEQIDALRLVSLNPVKFLVVPRFVGCVVSLVLLSSIASLVAFVTAMWVSSITLGIGYEVFLNQALFFVGPEDVFLNLFKAVIFGQIIPILACHYGLNTRGGAEGVGMACTKAVVYSALVIVILDFFITWAATVLL